MILHGLRTVFLPPRYREPITRLVMDNIRMFRIVAAACGLSVDIAMSLTFFDNPDYNPLALKAFLLINVPLLVLYGAAAIWLLKAPLSRFAATNRFCVFIECTTVMVWIQLTGSTTSYFVFFVGAFLLLIRVYLGYGPSVLAFGLAVVEYSTMFALEQSGVLPMASLYRGEVHMAARHSDLSGVAFIGNLLGFALSFSIGSLISQQLAVARRALGAAESTLIRLASGQKLGRLSGSVLADKYEIEELLGRGGMGEIYKARRLSDDTLCAVKVLHPQLVDDRNLERFRREAELASLIPGQVAPKVYDSNFTDTEERFIAMEYLAGEDLASYLARNRPLAVDAALDVLREIATALDAAHAQGVIHRDLKPQNIFLEGPIGARVRVRLLDFGISKLADSGHSLTMTHGVLGTPGYMAPEQIIGRPEEVGPATDVYALGVIAFECLTGQAAFPEFSLQDVLRNMSAPTPMRASTVRPELPRALDAVIVAAMAITPGLRPVGARQFVQSVARVLEKPPPLDTPTENDLSGRLVR